jgi:hypothetical protein
MEFLLCYLLLLFRKYGLFFSSVFNSIYCTSHSIHGRKSWENGVDHKFMFSNLFDLTFNEWRDNLAILVIACFRAKVN